MDCKKEDKKIMQHYEFSHLMMVRGINQKRNFRRKPINCDIGF